MTHKACPLSHRHGMYGRRPATAEDYDFLWRLHAATMQGYVERTWGWDEAFQEAFFRERFDPARSEILLVGTEAAGVLSVEMREAEIFVNNIQIAPEYQGRGIGTAVLRDVLAEAERRGVPVALQVLKVNRRARRLYERLGFAVTGDSETHYRMTSGRPAACAEPIETPRDVLTGSLRVLTQDDEEMYSTGETWDAERPE